MQSQHDSEMRSRPSVCSQPEVCRGSNRNGAVTLRRRSRVCCLQYAETPSYTSPSNTLTLTHNALWTGSRSIDASTGSVLQSQRTDGTIAIEALSVPGFPPDSLPGLTLTDIAAPSGEQGTISQMVMHMALLAALETVADVVGSDATLRDTTTAAEALQHPTAKPSVTSLGQPGPANYAGAVLFWQFTPRELLTAVWQALGQHIRHIRGCLWRQPCRSFVLAVTMTMNSIEVFYVSKTRNVLSVSRCGPQEFSFDPRSPGLRWLVRVLVTPRLRLG